MRYEVYLRRRKANAMRIRLEPRYGRILSVPLVLVLGVTSAHAESHINLTCTHGRATKKTTFADGQVRTETSAVATTFLVDVDLEHKTINGTYDAPKGQQLANGSVTIGGLATKLASEHEPGFQDTISIDRLSGTTAVTHLYFPADDCETRLGQVAACRTSETLTIYRCLPALTDFPSPMAKMMRLWQRVHHAFHLASMKRAARHWYWAVRRRLSPDDYDYDDE
jgi:hypothetical protein